MIFERIYAYAADGSDVAVGWGNLDLSILNEGWWKILVGKLYKLWEILKALNNVYMMWKLHEFWNMGSDWKCWSNVPEFVHKSMGAYLVVWDLKNNDERLIQLY